MKRTEDSEKGATAMRFEKVSYDQFAADIEKWMPEMSKMLYK